MSTTTAIKPPSPEQPGDSASTSASTSSNTPNAIDTSGKPLALRDIFTKSLVYDADGRATSLHLLSFSRPHMRSFHLAWMGFAAAFTSWFALSPLLKKTIKPDLGLSEADLANSDIANVASTVVFRVLIGPLVDKLGASRVMALILVSGSIPLALSGLVKNGTGLIILRAFIGVLGASFVPCQYWTTALFNPRVVGTANAVAGGWGNMGAGITNLLMPQVYAGFTSAGLKSSLAWRVSVLVPVAICFVIALMCWMWGDDKPGRFFAVEEVVVVDESLAQKKEAADAAVAAVDAEGAAAPAQGAHVLGGSAQAARHSVVYILLKALMDPNVLILMVSYACCFGVELSVDSIIGNYFIKKFGVDQQIGGLFAAFFGLMNLFSRATGGLASDFLSARWGMRARVLWLAALFLISASSIIGFSYATTIATASVAMAVFSYACQAGTGATFAIVPFLGPYMGAASGLIGAGGNVGGALFNVLFRAYIDEPATAFMIIGICVAVGGFGLSFLLRVGGKGFLGATKKAAEAAV
ncbi:High-affinity nitrate transporter 2.1 [Phlyctochytrium bullatum]|nr:High-affinity nitrate transporter 2.1 [Phlyctochytrium bullatum]